MQEAAAQGTVLGGTYRLERKLGEGGMGSVYEAAHLRVPRKFAVKLLNQEVVGNQEVFARFQREAQIASSLGSDHITQVFDFNYAPDGSPYMVLELLEGEDLSERLARGALTLAETSAVVDQTTRALDVAHANGIVHRDLKPSNIYMCRKPDGKIHVKILDFGISKVLHDGAGSTRTGLIMGTPNYMAPEQAEGRVSEVDARTDLFSLGAIIYECLTGRVAFQAPTPVGTIYQVCHAEPSPVRELMPGVPRAVEHVLVRALAKSRDSRYPNAQALREDFQRACSAVGDETAMLAQPYQGGAVPTSGLHQTTMSGAAGQQTATTVPPSRSGRSKAWIAIAAVVIVAAGVGITVVAAGGGGDHAAATPSNTDTGNEDTTKAPAPDTDEIKKPAPPPVTAPPPEPKKPAMVKLSLEIKPANAEVVIDGVRITGSSLELPRGDRVSKVVVSAKGYTPKTREFRPVADGTLTIALNKIKKSTPRHHHRRHVRKPKPKNHKPHVKINGVVEDKW